MTEREVHGLLLRVPDDWNDATVFRFAVPEDEVIDLPLRASGKPSPPKFKRNVIVTKYRLNAEVGETLDTVFVASNKQQGEQDPTFAVVHSGVSEYEGRKSVWQDITFAAPPEGVQIFQRQIAVDMDDMNVTLITVTSDKPNADDIAALLGF